jgi:uncharacterized protein YjdB
VNAATVGVTGVMLNQSTATLTVGDDLQLTETVSPSNATNKTVTWLSGNTSIATIDATGKVRAIAPGSATITVTTTDGNKMATCMVQVQSPTGIENPNEIQFNVYPSTTKDIIHIKAPTGTFIQIFDVAGTSIHSIITTMEETRIDLSNYQNGLYIIKSTVGTAKVIKK